MTPSLTGDDLLARTANAIAHLENLGELRHSYVFAPSVHTLRQSLAAYLPAFRQTVGDRGVPTIEVAENVNVEEEGYALFLAKASVREADAVGFYKVGGRRVMRVLGPIFSPGVPCIIGIHENGVGIY
jgi:hypothetical protein